MRNFLLRWFVCTLAVLLATYLIPGIHRGTLMDLCAASLLLGLLNAVVRPILMLLTLPLLVVTLGLFQIVINAALLYFVGFVLRPHFYVDGFVAAILGAVVISVVSFILNLILDAGQPRRPGGDKGRGGGPVIDV